MSSIAQVSRALRTVFEEEASVLARDSGLRERGMHFPELAYVLVLGWWQCPKAGPSAFCGQSGTEHQQARGGLPFRPSAT